MSYSYHIPNRRNAPSAGRPAYQALFVLVLIAIFCSSRYAAGWKQLGLSSASLNFGNVAVGSSSTLTETLTNTGTGSIRVSQATVQGTGFSISGLTVPLTLTAGESTTFDVTFAPAASGSVTGSITGGGSAGSSTHNLNLTISLSGTGVAGGSAPAVGLSPASLNFGTEPIAETTAAQIVTLTNTGSTTLSISGIAVSGTNSADFSEVANTCSSPLAAGTNCSISVAFTPSLDSAESASLSIMDNASGRPQTVALSGSGEYDIILSWTTSTSSGVIGYNVYRGTASGGESSTPLNSTPINGPAYVDTSVTAGTTYYYEVTAVSSTGTQSAESDEVSASVP